MLEFRKTPIPKGSHIRRWTDVDRTRVHEAQALVAMRTENLLNQLDAASIAPPSLRKTARMRIGPGAISASGGAAALGLPSLSDVEIVKESIHQIAMRLDMLTIEYMDTGQYRAMVVQDPNDHRNVRGDIHIAQVFRRPGHPWETGSFMRKLDYLIKALAEYTGIVADDFGSLSLRRAMEAHGLNEGSDWRFVNLRPSPLRWAALCPPSPTAPSRP